jgi:nicotinate-nucleotide--dimethylbenzimidazole phosphoribosyltransferase
MTLPFSISPLNDDKKAALQNKINQKTKPLSALGQLESLALQIGLIQNSLSPVLQNPSIVVFTGDHGVSVEGVSAYPQCVTAQMVINFLAGGAAVSVFSKQNGLDLLIVDSGVNADLPQHPKLHNAKIAKGTRNFLNESAMTQTQCLDAINSGAAIVLARFESGCNCIGFGEMGIGNTSSASLLMHALTDISLQDCIGRGTGLDDKQLENKQRVLQQATQFRSNAKTPLEILAAFGGFEIAMMVGAYLQAAQLKMLIMVDGFIATSALLIAAKLFPNVLDYCVFSHVSDENAHADLLKELKAKPLLNLNLRLGEGSAIALAFPLIQSAVTFLNEMASFEEAGVSK